MGAGSLLELDISNSEMSLTNFTAFCQSLLEANMLRTLNLSGLKSLQLSRAEKSDEKLYAENSKKYHDKYGGSTTH